MRTHLARRLTSVAAGTAVLALALAACGSSGSSSSPSPSASASAVNWQTVTSVAAGGGMNALIAAAKKEGTLNVIALPPNWANYGNIITTFEQKYGIKVNSENPSGSSQDELNAVKTLKGQSRQPDVLDVGIPFASSALSQGLLAPYQVAKWDQIPTGLKNSAGYWYGDYGGYISIGYNASVVKPAPTSFASLNNPAYKNMVALNGDPTKAGAAFAGVWAASLANGGSLNNITPGIDYFAKLKQAKIFTPVLAYPSTIQSGQTPIVIDWDYLQAGYAQQFAGKLNWKVVIPSDGLFANYYAQAIVANSPHPAAARLWEEFLYSDQGQNLWLAGLARPVRLPTMIKDGTATPALLSKLPTVNGSATLPDAAQTAAAQKAIAQNWATKVGG
ncbi:MAG: ABC transporter substrate-binding protein [Actinomycetes bacterium]